MKTRMTPQRATTLCAAMLALGARYRFHKKGPTP